MPATKGKWCAYDSIHPGPRSFLICFLLPIYISVALISLFSDFIPTVFGAYADQRFFQISCMLVSAVVTLVWLPWSKGGHALFASNWPVFLVSAAFLLLALPHSSGKYVWVEPGMYSLFFLAFALLGWRIQEQSLSKYAALLFVYVVTTACFFYAAMTVTVYSFAIADKFSGLTDIIPWGFVNMRYWSHIATWLLPILPLALIYGPLNRNRFWQVAVGFTAAMWWWMIFMTTARGTMLSLALAGTVVCIWYGRAVVPWLLVSLKFIVFGVLAWFLLSLVIPSIVFEELTVRTLHAGGSGRMPLWLEAWHMSLQQFPFGMGAQSWLTHQAITENFSANSRLGHPHNMYLMWAAEYGWSLVIALVMLIAMTLRNLGTKVRQVKGGAHECPAVLIAFTVAAIAGSLHAGLSAVFIVPASMLVGLLVLAILWALSLRGSHRAGEVLTESRRPPYLMALPITLTLVVVFGGGVWFRQVWEYHQAMVADLPLYEDGPKAEYWPRFWFHGNFPRPQN